MENNDITKQTFLTCNMLGFYEKNKLKMLTDGTFEKIAKYPKSLIIMCESSIYSISNHMEYKDFVKMHDSFYRAVKRINIARKNIQKKN